METTIKLVIVILLVDAILWGIWFGGLWSYRSAFASRLTDSYLHISISFAMPFVASSIVYIVAMRKSMFFRRYRVRLFKLSILVSRILYLVSSIIVYYGVLSGLELLYVSSFIISLAYAVGTIAGIAWTDYIADNLYEGWKPRYIALDSTLSTVGALIGTAIAGVLFAENGHVYNYGRLFLITSTVFLINVPMIMLVKEFSIVNKYTGSSANYSVRKRPSRTFYASIVLLYIAINLSASLAAPYIMYKLGGNELWIAMINSSSLVASLITPIIWGEALKKISSLRLAKIAIALSIVSNAVFPYLRSLELQIIRAFIAGAGGIGIWISIFSHIIRDVDAEHRIQHSSVVYLIQSITPAIAVNIGGFLADVLKIPEVVFLLSLLGLVSLSTIKM